MELVRLEQPDTFCLYAVGCNCLFGTAEEAIYHHTDSCALHDGGLHHLPPIRATVQARTVSHLDYRRCNVSGGISVVLHMAETKQTKIIEDKKHTLCT